MICRTRSIAKLNISLLYIRRSCHCDFRLPHNCLGSIYTCCFLLAFRLRNWTILGPVSWLVAIPTHCFWRVNIRPTLECFLLYIGCCRNHCMRLLSDECQPALISGIAYSIHQCCLLLSLSFHRRCIIKKTRVTFLLSSHSTSQRQ